MIPAALDLVDAVMNKIFQHGDIQIGIATISEDDDEETATEPKVAAGPKVVEPKAEAPAPAPAAESGLLGAGADVASRADALFAAIDLNSNGTLSLPELSLFLGPDAREVLDEFDPDGSKGAVGKASW